MNRRNGKSWPLAMALLVFTLAACGPCSFFSPPPPNEPIPTITISEEAASGLEQKIRQELQESPNHEFIIRITNDEVTSLVATKLADSAETPMQEPRIWFTRGHIYIGGRLVNILPIP
ncbi:MAG: hypothetical protein GX605_01395, partial [Chloroflexi bacterium]|nr:hypothetical protein [Chloroflexota bacterium]